MANNMFNLDELSLVELDKIAAAMRTSEVMCRSIGPSGEDTLEAYVEYRIELNDLKRIREQAGRTNRFVVAEMVDAYIKKFEENLGRLHKKVVARIRGEKAEGDQ